MGKRNSLPSDNSVNLYRLFGVTMASEYKFSNPLPRISGVPDVTFTCRTTRPLSIEGTKKPVYASRSKTDDGESVISIQTMEDCHVVHFAGSVDFYLSSDTIIAHLLDPACRYMVEILLLGEIFSLWLELQGIPTIHASAAVVDNNAIAFLSTNEGGKSGLAAAFTQQGHPILTDDILPIENRHDRFLARPEQCSGWHARVAVHRCGLRRWAHRAADRRGAWAGPESLPRHAGRSGWLRQRCPSGNRRRQCLS